MLHFKMVEASIATFALAIGVSVLAFPVGILLYSKLFPGHAETTKRKVGARLCYHVMWRVHRHCVQQKKDLFEAFQFVKHKTEKRAAVLEVGVGPGNNLSYLPADCSLSCLEPNVENRPYVERTLKAFPGIHLDRFVQGFAEDMKEFEDASFDAVVCTFTLCTVRRPDQALSEIKRVLKPGGLFFFLEHVAAPKPSKVRTLQEGLDWLWPTLADGCHLTRESWNDVKDAGFSSVKLEHFKIRTGLLFLNFGLYGHAVK